MTNTEQAGQRAVPDVDRRWGDVPCPVVVLDADGHVRSASKVALPMLSTDPDWLIEAHRAVLAGADAHAEGWLGDRCYTAHPVPDGADVAWWLTDVTRARRAEEALAAERQRTAFLSQASSTLLTSLNVDRCTDVAATLAAEQLADAAVVISPATRGRHPAAWCVRGERPTHAALAIDPRDVPGLAEALQGFPPVPSRWIDPATAPDWLLPPGFSTVGSIVVTPLPGHGMPAGALVLLRKAERAAFSAEEESLARLFAARAGAAMSAARMFAQQAAVTDTLMRELLPPALRQIDGVEFAGRYRAARDAERVGGDFYDIHHAGGPADEHGESLVVLGDVCGKGLDAAVLAGKIRNTLHALLPMASDHSRMLVRLNESMLDPEDTRFVTLVLASAVRRGATVDLRVTCAGHPPPLVIRADGMVEEVPTRGNLIGVLSSIESTTARLRLAPGETCLLYTDGIVEARGGPLGDEMFGEQRLRLALAGCAGMPADAVVEHVQMVAAQWIGARMHDDIAVVAITAPRGQHLAAVDGHGPGRYTA